MKHLARNPCIFLTSTFIFGAVLVGLIVRWTVMVRNPGPAFVAVGQEQRTTPNGLSPTHDPARPSGQQGSRRGSRAMRFVGSTVMDCKFFSVHVDQEDPDADDNPRIRISQRETVPFNFAQAAIPTAPGTVPGEYESSLVATLSFWPRFFRARHGNEIYIAGYPLIEPSEENIDGLDTSRLVIEKFVVVPATGAPYTERTKSDKPIGEPDALSELSAHIVGGMYIMPQHRANATLKRTLLGVFPVQCLEGFNVDPGGRYLVVADAENARLLQYALSDLRQAPTVIAHSAEFSCLSQVESISRNRWLQDGFKRLTIECNQGMVLLADSENDGVFEFRQMISHEDYETAGYWATSIIQEDYVFYTPTGLFP